MHTFDCIHCVRHFYCPFCLLLGAHDSKKMYRMECRQFNGEVSYWRMQRVCICNLSHTPPTDVRMMHLIIANGAIRQRRGMITRSRACRRRVDICEQRVGQGRAAWRALSAPFCRICSRHLAEAAHFASLLCSCFASGSVQGDSYSLPCSTVVDNLNATRPTTVTSTQQSAKWRGALFPRRGLP